MGQDQFIWKFQSKSPLPHVHHQAIPLTTHTPTYCNLVWGSQGRHGYMLVKDCLVWGEQRVWGEPEMCFRIYDDPLTEHICVGDVCCQKLLLGRVSKLSSILIWHLPIFSFLMILQFLKTDICNRSYVIFKLAWPGIWNWENMLKVMTLCCIQLRSVDSKVTEINFPNWISFKTTFRAFKRTRNYQNLKMVKIHHLNQFCSYLTFMACLEVSGVDSTRHN